MQTCLIDENECSCDTLYHASEDGHQTVCHNFPLLKVKLAMEIFNGRNEKLIMTRYANMYITRIYASDVASC